MNLQNERTDGTPGETEAAQIAISLDAEKVVECLCCYDEKSMENSTQCRLGHTFCLKCARKNAEIILGYRGSVSTGIHRSCRIVWAIHKSTPPVSLTVRV